MVTRKLIRVTSPEAAALAAKETSAAEDSATVNKQPTPILTNDSNSNSNGGGKKRALPTEDAMLSREKTTNKRQRADGFVIDLTDVPPQLPISKSEGHIKEGSSKYAGVTFDKPRNKWKAVISIDGKQHYIGLYENEEEAANDYARAVFKYRGQDALDKARERKSSAPAIDLSDVPPQPLIHKSKWFGGSKYAGIYFNKQWNKWKAQITIEGKNRHIGHYVSEEEAAANYARAIFKYKRQGALDKAREPLDLTDVPPQPPISRSKGQMGSSKYAGVSFSKATNKWTSYILIKGKHHHIGSYENEEEAAVDHARAVSKYRGQEALDKVRLRSSSGIAMDLSDVQPQLPILKGANPVKESSSKYVGVNFDKAMKKWKATIVIEGKTRHIGFYADEGEAAIDYARALFKYRGQDAVDKARKRNLSRFGTALDLTDVPPQPPISKSEEQVKEGASKYVGVTYEEKMSKWRAQIKIEGRYRHIGLYGNEEEAAVNYARAFYKLKGKEALDKMRERNNSASTIDLSDVPPQLPIPKSKGHIKEGFSKYAGVSFSKASNKWKAQIKIDGKQRHLGSYENEEEAAADYARALFKYRGQEALDKARKQESLHLVRGE